jgi:hypothetical protein
MLVASAMLLSLPWITGIALEAWPDWLRWALGAPILLSMIIIGRDQARKDKLEDTWVGDPRKSKLQNWTEKRRQRFSPRRGLGFFLAALVVFSVIIGFSAVTGSVASAGGAVAFVLIFSALAGLIGIFTEKVPF